MSSECFWSYNYRLITTVQQHENLQLIVASQVHQLWQHVVTHSNPVARISKPLWLNIRSTEAEVAGGQFHASWVTKTKASWSQVPRPRPRPRLCGSKTKTETRGFQDQDQDQDSEVPRSRPRPRLVKTGLETKTQVSRTLSLVVNMVKFQQAVYKI